MFGGRKDVQKHRNETTMATLKVLICHTCYSSSSRLTSPPDISPSSTSRTSGLIRPPNSAIACLLRPRAPEPFLAPVALARPRRRASVSATMASGVKEVLPPALTSTSDPPPIFDGTTRLYISYTCPFAQRVWITRNCKGLQDQIKLVPIDLQNRPAWYKEKVYPANKVPALEHNNKVLGESLDLIKYLEANFGGPSLLPEDPAKKEFAEELFSYTDTFSKSVVSSFKGEGDDQAAGAFDFIEKALSKFEDGPFFLGQFSLVDIAYAPFIERFRPYLQEVKGIDITVGRPKLATWIEEMNKNEAYAQTRQDPKELVESYKKRFQAQL
ncbi:glutathione S-transferase L3-like isoform X2 [Rhodamnia argentea]|uniref:Glutathione S-transferase L3-like isoform X2 n=1 Tax=Rhodamnia argentea TaxID=178133 RepID=A0ABM3HTM1_9MYRT|nr:glutathione S-transferase L3-like isoform X2 [Rhodamnia argentea]XP_048139957.1 glutathione S-transferase L3-like isoform X2 [Rhodamnia argentea]